MNGGVTGGGVTSGGPSNGIDHDRLEEMARATVEAMDAVADEAGRLAMVEVEGSSPDRRVLVRVNATGRILRLGLRDGVLRRYDTSALSELVTRTIRDTQRRARDDYERAVEALEPPEVAASEQELQRIWRE
jgi:DNA-binding protein YbaB